jgi:vacuolar-type H+-ATPase subunit H
MLAALRGCPAQPLDPQVEADLAVLKGLKRAEEAARSGIQGERLDRLIEVLTARTEDTERIKEIVARLRTLPPAVVDVGYR